MTEFVGRRFGLGVWFLAVGLFSCASELLVRREDAPDLRIPVLVTITAAVAALIRALRPNRLRLRADHFELITAWGGRRRVAWSDISPVYLVKLPRKGGRRTYDVVRFRFLPGRIPGGGEVTLPEDFEPTPLAILLLMNDFRDRALGQQDRSVAT